VILDDVPDRACLIVEATAPGGPEVFSHGDLHALDVIAVPDWFQEGVGETEVKEILHRLFAEKVIDPESSGLREEAAENTVKLLR